MGRAVPSQRSAIVTAILIASGSNNLLKAGYAQHRPPPLDTTPAAPTDRTAELVRASPDAPFMYHCHVLEHEDAGMMGQFVVS